MARKRKAWAAKEDVWGALAARGNGAITSDWRGRVKSVRFAVDGHTIMLDIERSGGGHSSETNTRFRAVYTPNDDLRFRVTRRTFLSGLRHFFGVPSLIIGHPAIDANWVVRSNSLGKVQSILIQPVVVKALTMMRSGVLSAARQRKGLRMSNVMMLEVSIPGIVTEPDRLEAGFDLIAGTLSHLQRIGSARREPLTFSG